MTPCCGGLGLPHLDGNQEGISARCCGDSDRIRIEWLANRFLVDQIDYGEATARLFERIGYTDFFSQILALQDAGSLPGGNDYYIRALQHISTPRIFFPDKEELDNLVKTAALLGGTIDADTSIGVGYVAQANVDFGFPGMLFPIFVIGLIQGEQRGTSWVELLH